MQFIAFLWKLIYKLYQFRILTIIIEFIFIVVFILIKMIGLEYENLADYTKKVLSKEDYNKIAALNNSKIIKVVDEFVSLCKPSKATVITDDPKDIQYVRETSIRLGEESKLEMKGHTIHYDSYFDQARDVPNTKVLIHKGEQLSKVIYTKERDEGLSEIFEIMEGVMEGKECIVRFFCLGPTDSKFSICALQLTDSFYVGHSEDLLYRTGYEEFKRLNGSEDFFYFIHSAGELEGNVTKNIDKRRIYVDLDEARVITMNNQYAGNSLGLKKLALRLAIYKANHEDWLAEHMFIMGIGPKGKDRITYFMGAYPSACGKTSTAMLPGGQIIGDDIAYIRADNNGYARAVNIEQGLFGIIRDVNVSDDPLIWKALTTPREAIFSNVLIHDDVPYWLGDGREAPKSGINHSGEWVEGKKDKDGKEIHLAHPNARYTIRIKELDNADPSLHDPEGVKIMGIFYGGRDSDTAVPIYESFDWEHGVFVGGIIESETTSATLGTAGVRKASPMANLDFVVVPFGLYLENYKKFGNKLEHCPKIYATNYFLKSEGKYCTGMLDKKVWVLWAEGRSHGEYEAIETPIGYIPKYEDLKVLFKEVLEFEYKKEDYEFQFSIRIQKWMEKYERMDKMYKGEVEIPQFFWDILQAQKERVLKTKEKFNADIIPPSAFSS